MRYIGRRRHVLAGDEAGDWAGRRLEKMRSGGELAGASEMVGRDDARDQGSVMQLFGRQAASAFLSYFALSLLFFGRGVLAHPATVYLGQGPDAQLYVWFEAWWAHAISHHLNPLLTTAVWVPSGANIAWTTGCPLVTCVLYPVTRLWGPIVSSNVLHLIAPPLAGWSAFVLCRYVVQRFWPAWLGGWLFAFSPFMLASMTDGILFVLAFPVPLAVWATLRRLAGELKARSFLTIIVLLLIAQFLLSVEIFASAALFGAIAIALAAQSAFTEERTRLRSVASSIIVAYAVSAAILLPYFYYMFAFGAPRGLIFPPWRTSIDLVNFLVPTSTNQLGNLRVFGAIAHEFLAILSDSGGYLGLPLVAIIALFARERWSERSGRFMVYMFASACVLAMGPFLEILGYRLMPLPGAGLAVMPLIDKALPGRFMMYAYLAAAVLVAIWLAEKSRRRTLRWALGLAIVPFMCPNLSASFWATPAEVPAFFSSGLYRQYIAPGEIVMVLPFGLFGEEMLWQGTTDMYFRMAGGYGFAPPVPDEDSGWPILSGLYKIAGVPEAGDQLKAYLANHNVGTVILGPRTHYLVLRLGDHRTVATWLRWPTIDRERIATDKLLASLDTQPLEIGGVTIYRLAPQTLAPYRQFPALEMQRRAARARFEALLLGAERYVAEGGELASLSPERAQQLGLLPQDWFGGALYTSTDTNALFHSRVVLGPSKFGQIAVGVEGLYDAIEPTIRAYRTNASRIYFPYPASLSPASPRNEPAMMVMTFDRAGLERAAAAAIQRQTAGLHPAKPARAVGIEAGAAR
jgi:hypothetical protein